MERREPWGIMEKGQVFKRPRVEAEKSVWREKGVHTLGNGGERPVSDEVRVSQHKRPRLVINDGREFIELGYTAGWRSAAW
jgi:hypothetical protein